jgi:hypothetical protein
MSEETVLPVESEATLQADETAAIPADKTATPADATAAPVETPEGEQKPERKFTQSELDEILQKRLAKEHRKAQRDAERRIAEALRQATTEKPAAPQDKPTPDRFQTTEEYVEAVSAWTAERVISEQITKRAQQDEARRQQADAETRTHAWSDAEAEAEDRYDDYLTVTRNPALQINNSMLEVIQQSDVGPDLAYFLGKNPAEAERIAKLSPLVAAKELGKLETKISAKSVAKSAPALPDPIEPIRTRHSAATADLSDSDSINVWLAKRNAQIKAKMAARKRA